MLGLFAEDMSITGSWTFSRMPQFPAGGITGAMIATFAAIPASSVIHHFAAHYHQNPGANAVAETTDVHIAQAAGTVKSFQAALTGVVPSVDRTVTLDLQRSTGGGAFATVLSAVITLSTSNTIRVAVAATISSAAYVAGDVFRVIAALAGSSGTNPQGVIATLFLQESAQ